MSDQNSFFCGYNSASPVLQLR